MKRLMAACAAALMVLWVGVAFAGDALMMATTTSTDNTGLLNYLAPIFEKDTGIELKWTAVGTGKALQMGQNCDVDVLLVHAPASEKKFIDAGYGVDRRLVMYNDFVIVGPKTDPAGVKGKNAEETMKTIAAAGALFASRGDNSGTHKKEKSLWTGAGMAVPDGQAWYMETGQGMMSTLRIASEKGAYSMTDRGTWITYTAKEGDATALQIVSEGDKAFFNQYSVIAINPAHCPDVQNDLAVKFMDWIVSPKTQKIIGDFKLLGKPLFIPNAK